jgi:hypothetical protein
MSFHPFFFLNLSTYEPATKMEVVEQGMHETLVDGGGDIGR